MRISLLVRKATSLFLVFSLAVLSSGLFAKERRGAELVIQRMNGKQVRGELVAVKRASLLIMEFKSAATRDINLEEIKVIRVIGKSKAGEWTFLGFIIGATIGAFSGYTSDPDAAPGREVSAAVVGVVFGLGGALLGNFIGKAAGKEEIFRIEGRTASQLESELRYLRSKARIPDYI